jgi:hypothetical protein
MLLVRSVYATGEFNGLQCFFVYDTITERLVYIGGSNNSPFSGATSTCYMYTLSPFELLARTEPMRVGETALVSVLHLGIVDGLYWSEEAGDFLPVLFGVFSACCGG